MSIKLFLKSFYPAAYGLLVYATIRLLQDTDHGFAFWKRPWLVTASEIGISLILGYVLIGIVAFICSNNDKRITASKAPKHIFKQELLTIIGITLLVENTILIPFTALTDDGISWGDVAYINTIPLLFTLIYYGVVRSRTYLNAYIEHHLLIEKLNSDQLQTELKFLKAQYHPHFLFNALNTVYFQIDEDSSGAKRSIELLSNLLRYQLYDQQLQVTVRQELEYLNDYIKLQQVRSTHKLTVIVNFDEKLNNQLVYPLLLLPFVENAFKYVGGDYHIQIEAWLRDNRLFLRVRNDLFSSMPITKERQGIGLENLRRRLELLYPNKHALKAERIDDRFVAELELEL